MVVLQIRQLFGEVARCSGCGLVRVARAVPSALLLLLLLLLLLKHEFMKHGP